MCLKKQASDPHCDAGFGQLENLLAAATRGGRGYAPAARVVYVLWAPRRRDSSLRVAYARALAHLRHAALGPKFKST